MKKWVALIAVITFFCLGCGDRESAKLTYPQARKADVVDDYHGTEVPDPYRWLEDAESEETVEWGRQQNQLADDYIASIPFYGKVEQRVAELSAYVTTTLPQVRGQRLFFQEMVPGKDHPIVYMEEGPDAEPQALLDYNTFGSDEAVSMFMPSISPDGNVMAYVTQKIHERFAKLKIKNISTGQDYGETIERIMIPMLAWLPDSSGFYYMSTDIPEEGKAPIPQLYFHTIDTPQAEDIEIFSLPDVMNPFFMSQITADHKYLVVTVNEANQTSTRIYYRPLSSETDFLPLIDQKGEEYLFLGSVGSEFYFQTLTGAPNGRIIAVDLNNPESEKWREVVPEREGAVLAKMLFFPGSKIINNQIVAVFLQDAYNRILIYNLDGSFDREIELPGIGTLYQIGFEGISGDQNDTEMYFAFESFIYPSTVFRYDFTDHEMSVFHQPLVDFDEEDFITNQIFYNSKDGTRVPMFITHRKDLKLDGTNPALIYAYGGFNLSLPPSFTFHLTKIPLIAWLEQGGVYAQPNLRGGNEYGEAWHQAAMLGNKQNVFDDFYAAAEWLIDNDYTSPEKLAIIGQSNGGLLTATAVTQRPDLYGAVISKVPVIDMLRYNLGGGGPYWVPEYGDARNPDHFEFLYAYSPLHNVKEGTEYPPVFIQTGEGDTNVLPFHAKKFAATLQAKAAGSNPILLRIQQKAAHGGTTPQSVVINEYSEFLCFLFKELGVEIK
ncbi:prolyl oligopeptidase family protein [Acidobacteriota bacterium]